MVAEVVDPHVHLWCPDQEPWYPMLVPAGMGAIAHDFLPEDYRALSAGQDVGAVVHVSATTTPRAFLDELRWVEGVAARSGWPAAALGTIEPDQPWVTVEADLAAQAASPLFRGVRVLYGLDPTSSTAARLVRALADGGHVFDLTAHPHEVSAYLRLLEATPELVVAVEHAGWPESADADAMREWRRGLDALAARPNTVLKISGLAMTLHSVSHPVQRPWIEGCLAAFGPERCMFASNFPVDGLFGSFDELYDTYRTVAGELPDAAQEELFSGTARRTYRI